MTEVAIKILCLVTYSIHHLVGFISIFNLLPLDQISNATKIADLIAINLVCNLIA